MSIDKQPPEIEARFRKLEAALYDLQSTRAPAPVSGANKSSRRIGLRLADLDDVGAKPTNGQFLRWRPASGLWVPET